jgi:hypothetical protein
MQNQKPHIDYSLLSTLSPTPALTIECTGNRKAMPMGLCLETGACALQGFRRGRSAVVHRSCRHLVMVLVLETRPSARQYQVSCS